MLTKREASDQGANPKVGKGVGDLRPGTAGLWLGDAVALPSCSSVAAGLPLGDATAGRSRGTALCVPRLRPSSASGAAQPLFSRPQPHHLLVRHGLTAGAAMCCTCADVRLSANAPLLPAVVASRAPPLTPLDGEDKIW